MKNGTITIELLQELTERRESDLRPVTKFTNNLDLKNAILKQFIHIESEVAEAKSEIREFIDTACAESGWAYNAALELIDVQTSCETLLQVLGYDEQARRELRKRVIQKNAERGYFDE